LQVVLIVICLGGSGFWVDTFKKRYNVSPDPLGFAVFASATGLILSLLMILTPHKELLNRYCLYPGSGITAHMHSAQVAGSTVIYCTLASVFLLWLQ
jgi:hypothetical protein